MKNFLILLIFVNCLSIDKKFNKDRFAVFQTVNGEKVKVKVHIDGKTFEETTPFSLTYTNNKNTKIQIDIIDQNYLKETKKISSFEETYLLNIALVIFAPIGLAVDYYRGEAVKHEDIVNLDVNPIDNKKVKTHEMINEPDSKRKLVFGLGVYRIGFGLLQFADYMYNFFGFICPLCKTYTLASGGIFFSTGFFLLYLDKNNIKDYEKWKVESIDKLNSIKENKK